MDAGSVLEVTYKNSYRGLERLVGPLADRLAPYVHANWISGIRPLLAGLVIWLMWHGWYWSAFAVYGPAALLDALDGPVARRRRTLKLQDDERFGAFFDAASDKFFIIPLLVFFAHWGEWSRTLLALANLAAGLVVAVETILLVVRVRDYVRDANGHPASMWGKIKLWAESIGAGALLLSYPTHESWTAVLGVVLLLVSFPLAVKSLLGKIPRRT